MHGDILPAKAIVDVAALAGKLLHRVARCFVVALNHLPCSAYWYRKEQVGTWTYVEIENIEHCVKTLVQSCPWNVRTSPFYSCLVCGSFTHVVVDASIP